MQLDEASSAFSWLKADALLRMYEKFGKQSITELSKDVQQPEGTVINYVRTAKAFPQDQREDAASFSIHFQASYADSYDDFTNQFTSNDRFAWLKKAVDENMSTRKLAKAIKEQRMIAAGENPETVARKNDALEKVNSMMKKLGALKDRSKEGDVDAYNESLEIHRFMFKDL